MLAAAASRLSANNRGYITFITCRKRDCAKRMLSNRINAFIERRFRCGLFATWFCVLNLVLREGFIRTGLPRSRDRRSQRRSRRSPGANPQHRSLGGPWTIGMIAADAHRKGLEVVFRRTARVRQRGMMWTLRCIGSVLKPTLLHKIDDTSANSNSARTSDWVGFTKTSLGELATTRRDGVAEFFGSEKDCRWCGSKRWLAAVPVIARESASTPEAIDHRRRRTARRTAGTPDSLAEQIEALVTGKLDWEKDGRSAATRHGEAVQRSGRMVHETRRNCIAGFWCRRSEPRLLGGCHCAAFR